MIPKDDEGQEWSKAPATHVNPPALQLQRSDSLGTSTSFFTLPEWLIDRILADHRDAQHLRERVRALEEALRVRGKCFHCQGTGKPNCVTCDDYQACRCRPGEGRYAEHCWNCKGTGLNAWAAALLSPAAATEGGERA